jgi:hypothetical protein
MTRLLPLVLVACVPTLGSRAPAPCRDEVPAKAIERAYENNPTAAESRYNDRWVRIVDAKVDAIDGNAVWAGSLRLMFDETRDVMRLQRRSILTACCEGDGRRGSDVRFEGCTLVRVESPLIGQSPDEEPAAAPRPPVDLDELGGDDEDEDSARDDADDVEP